MGAQWILENQFSTNRGNHNNSPTNDGENQALPGFAPGFSCLLDRRFYRYATAPLEFVENGWKSFCQINLVNIITNKSMI